MLRACSEGGSAHQRQAQGLMILVNRLHTLLWLKLGKLRFAEEKKIVSGLWCKQDARLLLD